MALSGIPEGPASQGIPSGNATATLVMLELEAMDQLDAGPARSPRSRWSAA